MPNPAIGQDISEGTDSTFLATRIASTAGVPIPFGAVPPDGVRATDDGHVYVLDAQAATVYILDSALQPLGSVGRRGRGPGELIQPSLLAVADDERVAVFDPGQSRFTVFEQGAFAWDVAWELLRDGVPRRIEFHGPVLAIEVESFPFRRAGGQARPRAPRLLLLSPDGTRRTAHHFPSTRGSSSSTPASRPMVFAPTLHWAVLDSAGLLVSSSDRYELNRLDPSTGDLQPFAARAVPPAARVGERTRELVRTQTLNRFTENRARSPLSRVDEEMLLQSVADMRFAERLPLSGEILAGMTSRVLVRHGIGLLGESQDPVPPDPGSLLQGSPLWDVFSGQGAYLGTLEFPAGFVPLDGWADRVVGIRVGDFGEVNVEVFRVESR